jgi:tetratricopeptide (TPR) repeat protein
MLAAPLVIAAGIWWWRGHERAGTASAALPARPALAGELAERIAAAELRARGGKLSALAELARLYHANGFNAEAARCYHALAQLDPREPRWPHHLAGLHAGLGQLEEARGLWERVLRRAPDATAARLRLGDVLLKLNRPAEAEAAYAAVLTREKENAFALAGLARLDLAAGRLAAAREKLERAAAASGGRIGADLLATACEQAGDLARAAALRARAKASGAFHDPPDPWLDEIWTDCFDPYRLAVAAGFADHAGDGATARRLIDRALQLAPADSGALYQRGLFALKARDVAAARRDFETCVRVAPEFSDAWLRLAELHAQRGDAAASAQALASGLARNPGSGALLAEHARRLATAGRPAEAAEFFERSLRARPDDAETAVKLAGVYFRIERVADGVAALHRALAAEPEHPGALTTLALHAIGSGDERAAREWMARVRAQVRVPAEMATDLAGEFRRRFGREL